MLTVALVAAGCAKGEKAPEPAKLKVLAFNASLFEQKYGSFYIATHPEDDLEVISLVEQLNGRTDLDAVVNELVEKENPDVIALPADFFARLRDSDTLLPLDDYVQKDRFDLADVAPAVLDSLRADGRLYGLAATFTGSALYYNKATFDRYSIAYPSDFMTWDEVFTLAKRFSKEASGSEAAQFGLDYRYSDNPFMMALHVGDAEGLSVAGNRKFTLNSDGWIHVFENVKTCLSSGACLDRSQLTEPADMGLKARQVADMPFLAGNVAMAVEGSELYRTLTQNPKAFATIEWGMATVPVSALERDAGAESEPDEVFAIPRRAPQPSAAWRLVQYLGGEDYAKVLPRIEPSDLPVRPAEGVEATSRAVFYKLQRDNRSLIATLRSLPASVIQKMDESSNLYMPRLLGSQLTTAEVIEKMEADLQFVWDKELAKSDNVSK
ncbi:ABC transporter substrate-binding protein [Cohnella sp. GCM10020058]|uniref:ABC transporter substrate-binding protein n=1 Tax=Cohnella sp. GCM10020058 TaxID=3317330 RepID=UPI00364026E4